MTDAQRDTRGFFVGMGFERTDDGYYKLAKDGKVGFVPVFVAEFITKTVVGFRSKPFHMEKNTETICLNCGLRFYNPNRRIKLCSPECQRERRSFVSNRFYRKHRGHANRLKEFAKLFNEVLEDCPERITKTGERLVSKDVLENTLRIKWGEHE